MSVAVQLGLKDEGSELLVLAGRRWPVWATQHPALAAVDGPPDLRGWLRGADPTQADDVLRALATLAAVDGDNDIAAAAILSWALLPGACALANRLQGLSPRIDEIVAAQLWVEVRTFPWRRLRKVAANILMNTRSGVLRECGAASQTRRVDRTWHLTSPVDPCGPLWAWDAAAAGTGPAGSAAEELLDVLEWACANDVISGEDRALLLCLVAAAERASTTRVGRGAGGLMANDVSAAVADEWGISPVTVRRRARRSLRALSAACSGTQARSRRER